jgi:hypothetical protein
MIKTGFQKMFNPVRETLINFIFKPNGGNSIIVPQPMNVLRRNDVTFVFQRLVPNKN